MLTRIRGSWWKLRLFSINLIKRNRRRNQRLTSLEFCVLFSYLKYLGRIWISLYQLILVGVLVTEICILPLILLWYAKVFRNSDLNRLQMNRFELCLILPLRDRLIGSHICYIRTMRWWYNRTTYLLSLWLLLAFWSLFYFKKSSFLTRHPLKLVRHLWTRRKVFIIFKQMHSNLLNLVFFLLIRDEDFIFLRTFISTNFHSIF